MIPETATMRKSSFAHHATLASGALFLVVTSGFAPAQTTVGTPDPTDATASRQTDTSAGQDASSSADQATDSSPGPVAATGTTTIAASAPLVLSLQQDQVAFQAQVTQLVAQGDTPAQIYTWMNQNPIIQAQVSLALELGASSSAQPLPIIDTVIIPEEASQDLEDFLTAQGNLANLDAAIHNQLLQSGVVSGTQEASLFQQQAAGILQAQVGLAQKISTEEDSEALPVPPPLVVPPNTTSSMQAFLVLRDQLVRGEVQLHNQNLDADPNTRSAALQAWQQANAAQFQQLQQLAQNLSTPTPSSSSQ